MNPQQRAEQLAYLMQQGMSPDEAKAYMNNPTGFPVGNEAKTPNMVFNDPYNGSQVQGMNSGQNYNFMTSGNNMPNVLNQQPTQYNTDNLANGIERESTSQNNILIRRPGDFKTAQEYITYMMSQGDSKDIAAEKWNESPTGIANPYKEPDIIDPDLNKNKGYNPYLGLFAGSMSAETGAAIAGMASVAKPGTKGKYAGVIGGTGVALSELFSVGLKEAGAAKANGAANQYIQEQLYGASGRKFGRQEQFSNNNTTGNMPLRDGGVMDNNHFFQPRNIDIMQGYTKHEEGGEQMPQEGMQEQMQQPQPQDQMQQIQMMVAQALQQGQDPQAIVQALIQKGVPEQQAMQIVTQVAQQMQQSAQGQQMPQEEQPAQEPEMKKGGKFNHKVGDYIEFKSKGEMKSGKIKKIENGQIFL